MTSASPAVPRGVSAVSGGLSLLGLVVLLLTIVLAFETPDTTLLAVSALLVFTFPLAALWHLAATRTLTRAEKRLWLRELTGAEAFSAMSDYVRSPDLRATAQRRAKVRPKA
jgi:hypothetical protein